MNIIYHLDTAIKTLLSIEPKQCDSYVDSEIKYYINELKNIRTYAECFGNEDEKLEFLHNGVKFDPVGKPEHYNQGKFEVIDVIEDWNLGFHLGNVIKYVARNEHKENPLEDLKKAKYYLDRKIKELEK